MLELAFNLKWSKPSAALVVRVILHYETNAFWLVVFKAVARILTPSDFFTSLHTLEADEALPEIPTLQ